MEEKEQVVEKTIKVSRQTLYALFAIVAAGLFVIVKICANFGVMSSIFYGIMSIFIYLLSFAGIIFSYLGSKKNSLELWLNVAVFLLAVRFM